MQNRFLFGVFVYIFSNTKINDFPINALIWLCEESVRVNYQQHK